MTMKLLKKIFSYIYYLMHKFYEESVYGNYRVKYNISPNFHFNGESIRFYGDGNLTIRDNSYIGRFSSIQVYKGCKVEIGKNCSIGQLFTIYTSEWKTEDIIECKSTRETLFGDVLIGDNCWIGSGVFIRGGIKIGNNVVIGAHSVVLNSLPDNCVAAGCPAKIVKYR